MTRALTQAISRSISQGAVNVFWAVDLLFDSPNDLYFWSGLGDLTLDGNTYTGSGDLMNVSEIRESSDIAAYGATLTLSGIPSNVVSLALDEPYQGRRCIVKFGVIPPQGNLLQENEDIILLEDDSNLLLDESDSYVAFTVFSGEMDQMNIDLGPDTATISLDVESRMIDLQRPRIRRYTDADQQSRYSGDLAFEFVTRLQKESLEWG